MNSQRNPRYSWPLTALSASFMAVFWVFAIVQLCVHLANMRFLPAFFFGTMVFVIPFHLWRDVPMAFDGWKEWRYGRE